MLEEQSDEVINRAIDAIIPYRPNPHQVVLIGLSIAKGGFDQCSARDKAALRASASVLFEEPT